MGKKTIDMCRLEEILKEVNKPGRYIGNELNTIKKKEANCYFAFAFPDIYEIGMSFIGLQILYDIVNKEKGLAMERVFLPGEDLEEILLANNIPLFTLENKIPLREMDLIGFTLQYELSYSNILNILKLANIPFRKEDRNETFPLIMAGGPCAFNPEPLADIFDFFVIGDGEEILPKILKEYADDKGLKGQLLTKEDRHKFLRKISEYDGVYVPELFDEDLTKGKRIKKAIVENLDTSPYPLKPLVPLIDTVHDRAVIETFRGCTRGCRFCQAGMIYRPVRERSLDNLYDISLKQLENTGHDELSLLSLSTSDLTCFEPLLLKLMDYAKENMISISLPSLRLDNFSFQILGELQKQRKSGLTFAPEAGSQRLRDVINKGITGEDILESTGKAIDLGWKQLKLYFMIGLPSETYEDLDGIIDITKKILSIYREKTGKSFGFKLTISVSNFVPKAFTPFQWFAQDSREEFRRKHDYLKERLKIKGVSFQYHDNDASFIEAVFARGDRKLSETLIRAFELGCKMDGWSEHFNIKLWEKAFEETGLDPEYYANRERNLEEILPWDFIESGVSKSFLKMEWKRALKGQFTEDCRLVCEGCGVNKFTKCALMGSAAGAEQESRGKL